MRDQFKPFLIGVCGTLVIASALFGAKAFAEPPKTVLTQERENLPILQIGNAKPYPLVTIKDNNGGTYSLAADLIDQVNAFELGDGNVEIHVLTYHELSGEMKQQVQLTVTAEAHKKYVDEANRLRK